MVRIYLASPLGFSITTRPFLLTLKERLLTVVDRVHDPWEEGHKLLDAEVSPGIDVVHGEETSSVVEKWEQVGKSNMDGIDSSRVVVAVLDGPDVDSGTASEIGYAFARGKRIYGYRGDKRRAGDAEGVKMNLQVQYWIEKSKGKIVDNVDDLLQALAEWKSTEGDEANGRERNPKARMGH